MQPLNTQHWIEHFQRNQENRPEPDWEAALDVPSRAYGALLQSLREFELGDGGGPASLIAFNAESFRGSSPDIRKIVDLWFMEEKEHSRLLGGAVSRLGGEPIDSHWSFRLFCFLRHRLGVRFELQILTLTELVSTSYYTLLRSYCADRALCDVFGLILRDESGHVSFHNDRLAADGASGRGIRGCLWGLQFFVCGYGAATVLWISHGRCLRLLGASTGEFYGNVRRQIRRFVGRLNRKASRDEGGVSAIAMPVHGTKEGCR
jgi:hypothetical protein